MFINFPERDESENSLTPANLRERLGSYFRSVFQVKQNGDNSAPSGSTMLSATEVQFDVSSIRHNARIRFPRERMSIFKIRKNI